MTRKAEPSSRNHLATLTFKVGAGAEVQLLPAGEFKATDGRAMPWGAWILNEANAKKVIELANAKANEFVIDYEHQTQLSEQNGQPAPAAGWFKTLEFRPGQGLFATDVRWTARAKQYIADEEYRYLSAAFSFDPKTGDVTKLVCAALTNNPGLDGMNEVQLAALRAHFSMADSTPASGSSGHQLENTMNLTAAIRAALSLKEDATEVEALSAIATLKAQADKAPVLENQIATLKSAAPDPAKYVSVDKVNELNTEIAALKSEQRKGEVETILAKAKADGKVVPSVEPIWRDIGNADIAKLKALVESTPANPALAGDSQTKGKGPSGDGSVATLTSEQKDICRLMGIPQESYLATLKAQAESAAV